MPDLAPEHVEAVAVVALNEGARSIRDCSAWTSPASDDAVLDDCRMIAEGLLTSTDPDVHAALLAALVRAGVLKPVYGIAEESALPDTSGKYWVTTLGRFSELHLAQDALRMRRRKKGWNRRWIQRQYLTEWEDFDA